MTESKWLRGGFQSFDFEHFGMRPDRTALESICQAATPYIVMAHVVMAYIAMAYIVLA